MKASDGSELLEVEGSTKTYVNDALVSWSAPAVNEN